MIMHDVHYNKFNIRQEDTLENPQHEGEKFEAIVLWQLAYKANIHGASRLVSARLLDLDGRVSEIGIKL